MRNHKPERGPLFFQILVSIFVLVFAVFWTVLAAQGAGFMAIFGIFFIVIAIFRIIMLYRYATCTDQKDTSAFHSTEQPSFDRFDLGEQTQGEKITAYCPSCGAKVEKEDRYCGDCGRKLN